MAASLSERNFSEFCGGKKPESFLYEDEQCVVFEEVVRPQAPVHFIVVPRKVIPRLSHVTDDEERLLGHMLLVAKDVALQQGLGSGYHVIVDEDYKLVRLKAIHVFGRALHHMLWPVGPGAKL